MESAKSKSTTPTGLGPRLVGGPISHGAGPPGRRITPVFVAAALLLVTSTAYVYRVGLNTIRAQEKMSSELLVAHVLDEFLLVMTAAETGQRGFLLTGEESYLQPYTNARAQAQAKLDHLLTLARAGELPSEAVERMAAAAQRKLSEMETTVRLRREQGRDAALAVLRDNRGPADMELVRTEVARLRSEEEKEFVVASGKAKRSSDIRTATFIGVCLVNLLFLAWAFRRIGKEVARRDAAGLEVERQREILATTLASIGDAVITTDPEGQVVFLNHEAEILTGWTSAQAAGHPLPEVFRIINEQSREPAESPVEKVMRQGNVVGLANHTLLIRRDGQEIPIDDSAAPVRRPGGPLVGVILVFRNFTEQRQREQRLAEQARLLDLTNDTILVRDGRDRITYWNRGAEKSYGYSSAEALGRVPHDLLKTKFSEPLEKITEALHRDHRWTGELIHTRRDGGQVVVHSRWVLDRDAHDDSFSILETDNDVTEQKRSEEALRAAHEQLSSRAVHLESLVQQRTARLNETIGDLEAFSYSIVHDLRSPLRAMQNFAQLLAEDCGPLSPTGSDYVRRITTAAERMDRLIQDVLNYSRISRTELALLPLDPGTLLRGMIESYPAFQPSHAQVEVAGPFPLVLANEAALTQCVSNLLGNAVKFVAPGVRPHVRVWGETRGPRVRLNFRDNGIGIEPDAHEKIFRLFQRLSKQYDGTGVGLSIVKKAAERMGGQVGLESQPGQGSTFWIELDGATNSPAAQLDPAVSHPPS
jgi:PAS domain S-box-containing protein